MVLSMVIAWYLPSSHERYEGDQERDGCRRNQRCRFHRVLCFDVNADKDKTIAVVIQMSEW
jgi:hypothetical protein